MNLSLTGLIQVIHLLRKSPTIRRALLRWLERSLDRRIGAGQDSLGQVPHYSGLGYLVPQTLAAMRGIKAEGGWGVVNTEYCSTHPTSDDTPYPSATNWDDGDVAAVDDLSSIFPGEDGESSVRAARMILRYRAGKTCRNW
jgi:hypothetical protein